MLCPVGRTYNESHPTCRTCQIGCQKPKRVQRSREVKTHHNGKMFITTQYLYSMNHWHGRPRYVYTQYRNEWQKVLKGMAHVWGQATQKRYLKVRRYVSRHQELIKDRDNLIGALKPVKDVLEREGVIVNDSDEYLEFDITQDVDARFARVEIELEAL